MKNLLGFFIMAFLLVLASCYNSDDSIEHSLSKDEVKSPIILLVGHDGVNSKNEFEALLNTGITPLSSMLEDQILLFKKSLIFGDNKLRGFNFSYLMNNLDMKDFLFTYELLFSGKVFFYFDENDFNDDIITALKINNSFSNTRQECKLHVTPHKEGSNWTCPPRKDDCCVGGTPQ